mgnify:CR=1 FL=1
MPPDPAADGPEAVAGQETTLPVALTVAGSDSGGGAGIQADLKTFEARDVFGTSAVTAITAQNTTGVTASQPLDPETVREQIRAVVDDFPIGAVKTGMLANADIVDAVATAFEALRDRPHADPVPVVVDPVIVAESGDPLLDDGAIDTITDQLLPLATLVTPNVHEAERLTAHDIQTNADVTDAAHTLVDMGATAALVTGGHLGGDPVDVLVAREPGTNDEPATADELTVTEFEHNRIPTDATHGSGCTLSAAITAELASGARLVDAVEAATEFVTRAIRFGYGFGDGAGPVHHLAEVRSRADVPARIREVRDAVAELSSPQYAPLVPEVGMNVTAAPRYATSPEEVVAVEGRLHRTSSGVRATGGVAPGASSHVARFLLGVREADPSVQTACNVRHSSEIGSIIREQWDVEVIDRTQEPEDVSGTMDWAARTAMQERAGVDGRTPGSAPDAVLDDGAVGKEAMVRVLAGSVNELLEKLREISDLLELDADVVEPFVVDGEVDEERRE